MVVSKYLQINTTKEKKKNNKQSANESKAFVRVFSKHMINNNDGTRAIEREKESARVKETIL